MVFGKGSAPPAGTGGTTTSPPPAGSADPSVQQALDEAQQAYEDGPGGHAKGDWPTYGEAQKKLGDALKQAQQAERDASASSAGHPGAPPSATPGAKGTNKS